MLLALQTAITALLGDSLPALFVGDGGVQTSYGLDSWTFDPNSADPVAGEPGPEDAVDLLPFDPMAPTGPYALTRPPYPGPKRVYLRSAVGDLIPLSPIELNWDLADAKAFSVLPRPGRELEGFNQLEVHYGVVAAGSSLKLLHQATLSLSAADDETAAQVAALALAVLLLNRDTLRQQAGFAFNGGSYQAIGSFKKLSFVAGTVNGTVATVNLTAELALRVERLLGEDEGLPIAQILSPGRPASGRKVDIDPMVQN